MEEAEEQKTSKFNEAVSILRRINALWIDAHIHSRQGKLIMWSQDLDRIWMELVSGAGEEIEKGFNKFYPQVQNCITKSKSNRGEFDIDNIKLYPILTQKEIFLRKLQDKQGKGMLYSDPFEDDFE